MSRLSRQLNSVAFVVLGVLLMALRPWCLVLLGLAGASLSLMIGNASSMAKAIAVPFVGLAFLGAWWGCHNRRRGLPPPAIISAKIVHAEGSDDNVAGSNHSSST